MTWNNNTQFLFLGMTKSCFWNFFEMVEQDRVYKCMFCQKSVAVYPKSVGNLKRHIANVHKKQFDLIMKYEGLETEKMISSAACGSEGNNYSVAMMPVT